VKLEHELDKLAREAGTPLNKFISLRTRDDRDGDALRKRDISRATAHLGQEIERRGQSHVGVTNYEKSPSGRLHAHHLVYIAPSNDDIVVRWGGRYCDDMADSDAAHAIPAQPCHIGYVTKERLPLSPEFEAMTTHKRRAGARIPGPRFTMTAAAKGLFASKQQPASEASAPAWTSAVAASAIVTPAAAMTSLPQVPAEPVRSLVQGELQLVLLDDYRQPVARQIARLRDYVGGLMPPSVAMEVEHLRRRLGLTQSELAQRAGISQPQLANVVAGRFGVAAWPAARIRDVLLVKAA
jgi:hypothetical protein